MFNWMRYCLVSILIALAVPAMAAPNYQLYIDGVLYKAPTVLEKGLPYFPVDVLSQATGVSVSSFDKKAVRLAGSPVDFAPLIRQGRPYLPAEAFAMATGSVVEIDQTRGLVLYTKSAAPTAANRRSSSQRGSEGQTAARPGRTATGPGGAAAGPGRAPRVQMGDESLPEAPVGAPPGPEPRSIDTAPVRAMVTQSLKDAAAQQYAERYLRHKLYWASKIDPANMPHFQNFNLVPGNCPIPPHPWGPGW